MPRYFPELEEFERIVAGGAEIVPVYRQLLMDRLTPVTAFELHAVDYLRRPGLRRPLTCASQIASEASTM